MNPADPRWLEILKASGWQTSALTIACGLIVLLVKADVIPTNDDPIWIAFPAIGTLIFGCLSLAALGSFLGELLEPAARFNQWQQRGKEIRSARDHIPYMTGRDRKIIGYLLHHNQKTFQAMTDGGYAAPLISQGIIQQSAQHGQAIDLNWVPFVVPDHIWTVLEANRAAFSYKPPANGETEVYPWAIPWMVR